MHPKPFRWCSKNVGVAKIVHFVAAASLTQTWFSKGWLEFVLRHLYKSSCIWQGRSPFLSNAFFTVSRCEMLDLCEWNIKMKLLTRLDEPTPEPRGLKAKPKVLLLLLLPTSDREPAVNVADQQKIKKQRWFSCSTVCSRTNDSLSCGNTSWGRVLVGVDGPESDRTSFRAFL